MIIGMFLQTFGGGSTAMVVSSQICFHSFLN